MRQVEPLIPSLRRYARSLLREPAAADDLVLDCLERVIRQSNRIVGRDRLAYVFEPLRRTR